MKPDQKEYCLYITFKCNWFCDYCIMDTHNIKDDSSDLIFQAKGIEPNSRVCITGGEPGLANKKLVYQIFDILNEKKCMIHLNTNGLFLQRYPELLKYISSITYHCSENLDAEKIKTYPEIQDIDYRLILTDNNVYKLEEFLKINNDVTFNIIGSKLNTKFDGSLNITLSNKNMLYIYKNFKHHIRPDFIKELFNKCCTNEIDIGFSQNKK